MAATQQGKVVLVTGASSGIGAGTAIHMARLGCSLALTGRNEENLLKTVKKCEEEGIPKEQIFTIIADLAHEEETKKVMEQTIEKFGKLDVLINNAGIVETGTIETHTLEQYDRVMNINTRAVFYLTQLAIPHLTKTKGSIVNVSSITGSRSFAGVLGYCMSKAAIDQFTRCTALELAPKGIRVNAVNPGVITTEIHKRGGMNEEQYQQFLERTKTTHALGRPGEVNEVAQMIVFLAFDTASYITGTTIPIDGGRHAMCPR
ncbi:unnamed protein product [Owenia fusiformis]|uniref:Ketoreductase domain-containing protein n=1 Tax=Owenia fusiformis TaxID=6347 RepID=A0A8J1TME0_OWEFU|nr:unnamed protein product [Owenia fusiformis]